MMSPMPEATAHPTDGGVVWQPLLPLVTLAGDTQNRFAVERSPRRVTHLRLALHPDRGVARLENAFRLYVASEDVRKRLHAARIHDWQEGVKKGVITQAEGEKLATAHDAVMKVIEVDDFAPEALSPIYKKSADVHQFFQELGEQRAAS